MSSKSELRTYEAVCELPCNACKKSTAHRFVVDSNTIKACCENSTKCMTSILKSLNPGLTGLGQNLTEKLNFAVNKAVVEHHISGQSVVVWRDGKLVEIPPSGSEQIVNLLDEARKETKRETIDECLAIVKTQLPFKSNRGEPGKTLSTKLKYIIDKLNSLKEDVK
jgi:hypothetical protein